MALPCCMSSDELSQRQRSKLIDKQIAKEKVFFRRKVKILLLGAGESGKSTFLKQMRIIHGRDYSTDDLHEFKPIIYSNVLKGMKVLADARRKLKIPWGDPNNQVFGDLILSFQSSTIDTQTFLDYVDCVKHLWQDEGIQESYRRRNEFQLVRTIFGSISTIIASAFPRPQSCLQRPELWALFLNDWLVMTFPRRILLLYCPHLKNALTIIERIGSAIER